MSATVLSALDENELPGVSVTISPSPNNGTFVLDLQVEGSKDLSAEIIDVTGRIIYTRELKDVSGNVTERFSLAFGKGMYFVSLRSPEGRALKKFLVE